VALRIAFTFAIGGLLGVSGLRIAGGLFVIYLAVKLPNQASQPPEIDAKPSLLGAVRAIIVADPIMLMDNVLALAAAAKGSMPLIVCRPAAFGPVGNLRRALGGRRTGQRRPHLAARRLDAGAGGANNWRRWRSLCGWSGISFVSPPPSAGEFMTRARRITVFGSVSLVVVSLMTQAALADESASTVDKSAYSLFNPTPTDAMRAFAPERPSKILNPFTVDAGHFQIESDILNYTHANTGAEGTQLFQTADPTIKLGLTNSIDFELVLNGYQWLTTRDRRTGEVIRAFPTPERAVASG
jgi:hypothetical protein